MRHGRWTRVMRNHPPHHIPHHNRIGHVVTAYRCPFWVRVVETA